MNVKKKIDIKLDGVKIFELFSILFGIPGSIVIRSSSFENLFITLILLN